MRNVQLDKLLVIDIESSCYDGQFPDGEQSEIIEIGICLLDLSTGEILHNDGLLIKPMYSTISPFCTQLTTITKELLDIQGMTFNQACGILIDKYKSKSRIWCSYGNYDLNQFKKDCENKNVKYPFGASHINVKTLFAVHNRLFKEVGMDKALTQLNIPLEGTHHRGKDDVLNIAKILKTFI